MLDSQCRVRSVNAAAERLFGSPSAVSTDHGGCFRCCEEAVNRYVRDGLANWFRAEASSHPKSFLVNRPDGDGPLRITVFLPSRLSHRGFFRGPECILILEDLSASLTPDVIDLRAHYKLTAAEARIIAGLTEGRTVNEIAVRASTSPATVRLQLKQAFSKMGVHRQVDAVRLAYTFARRF